MVCKEIRLTTESKRKYPLNFAAILDEEEIDLFGTFGADTGGIMLTGECKYVFKPITRGSCFVSESQF